MIKLSDIVNKLSLTPIFEDTVDREVSGGYVSDLLSDAMSNTRAADLWVTNQKHQNCVAVASLLDLSAIIICGGIEPDADTIEKAKAECVPLYVTDMSAFDVSGRLYEMGLRGPMKP